MSVARCPLEAPVACRPRLDAAEVRRRLGLEIGRLERPWTPSRESVREVLAARSRTLAAREPGRPAAGSLELVTFSSGGRRYAVETRFVREAVRLAGLTPVPGAPAFVAGATIHGGEILPLVDVGRLLDTSAPGSRLRRHVLVLGSGGPELGVVADAAEEVRGVDPRELRKTGRRFVLGVAAGEVQVLDGEALLADPALLESEMGRPA